ncbi:hypothetical protein ACEPAH_1995 [Sanghuangporus vaninii]
MSRASEARESPYSPLVSSFQASRMGSYPRDYSYSYRSSFSYSVPSGRDVHVIGSNGTPVVSISNTVRTQRSDPRHNRPYDSDRGASSSASSPQMAYYTTRSGSHRGYDTPRQGHAVPRSTKDKYHEDKRTERRDTYGGYPSDKYVYDEPTEFRIPKRSTPVARSDKRHAHTDHRNFYALTKEEIDERMSRIQRHKSDIESYIQNAESDTSGYDWEVEIGYWRYLLQEYDALRVDDPAFMKLVDKYRGKVFFTLRKGIDRRNEKLKEDPTKGDPGGAIFSRLSRLADEKIDEYRREVNRFKKEISA